jgi:prophage regulatory protein
MSQRFIRLGKVMETTGKTRSSIYAEMGKGEFPKSIKISARAVAWIESDIEQWKREKLEAAGR